MVRVVSVLGSESQSLMTRNASRFVRSRSSRCFSNILPPGESGPSRVHPITGSPDNMFRRVLPKALQVVEFPRTLEKYVDDETEIVH